jgi:hypothetical protein
MLAPVPLTRSLRSHPLPVGEGFTAQFSPLPRGEGGAQARRVRGSLAALSRV